ncbi:MAG: hypothetical protein ACRD1K_14500 [Acidimicrobiales bacterium]
MRRTERQPRRDPGRVGRVAPRVLLVAGALLTTGWFGLNAYAAVVIAGGGRQPAGGRNPATVGLAFTDVT